MEIKEFSPTSHKIKAVIYGASGAGKTYFAATAPAPIFASAEAGLLSTVSHKKKIDPVKYVEVKKVEDLRELLSYLQKGEHKFKTVVIDSISEINEIIKEGIERKRGSAMIQKDWGDLFKVIKGILRGFRDLDMHVIFIAQEKAEKDEQKTEKVVPMLNGKAAIEIAYFMDIVAYCYVDKMGENKITAQPSEKLLTKCRGIELPADAPDDFEEWIKAIEKIQLSAEKVEKIDVDTTPAKAVKLEAPKAAKIQADTSKALFAEWGKFYERTGKDPKQSVNVLKATLKKEFNVDSSRELSEEQASGFVERLRAANKKAKQEKKLQGAEPKTVIVDEGMLEQKEEIQQEEAPENELTSTPEGEIIEQQ